MPGSLRCVADVRAARTAEKIGHFGRDDRLDDVVTSIEVASKPARLTPKGAAPRRKKEEKKVAALDRKSPPLQTKGGAPSRSVEERR